MRCLLVLILHVHLALIDSNYSVHFRAVYLAPTHTNPPGTAPTTAAFYFVITLQMHAVILQYYRYCTLTLQRARTGKRKQLLGSIVVRPRRGPLDIRATDKVHAPCRLPRYLPSKVVLYRPRPWLWLFPARTLSRCNPFCNLNIYSTVALTRTCSSIVVLMNWSI